VTAKPVPLVARRDGKGWGVGLSPEGRHADTTSVSRECEPRRAGAYAEQRYKNGRRNYRRKAFPVYAAVFGPFILAGIAVLIVEGHPLTWAAGLVSGTCVMGWMVMRDEPPFYIEKWHEGAEGERKTAKALEPLEQSGVHVFHDVRMRYGNYDHIAVGRAGVFLLETKNPAGVVELRDGVPHVRRRLDPDADDRESRVRPRTLSAAARLKEDIEQRTGHRTWVQAVVVYWSEFPEGLVDDGRCVFLHGTRLRPWIREHSGALDQDKVDEIAAAIASIANHDPHVAGTNIVEQHQLQTSRRSS
jgi:hypothetical protein